MEPFTDDESGDEIQELIIPRDRFVQSPKRSKEIVRIQRKVSKENEKKEEDRELKKKRNEIVKKFDDIGFFPQLKGGAYLPDMLLINLRFYRFKGKEVYKNILFPFGFKAFYASNDNQYANVYNHKCSQFLRYLIEDLTEGKITLRIKNKNYDHYHDAESGPILYNNEEVMGKWNLIKFKDSFVEKEYLVKGNSFNNMSWGLPNEYNAYDKTTGFPIQLMGKTTEIDYFLKEFIGKKVIDTKIFKEYKKILIAFIEKYVGRYKTYIATSKEGRMTSIDAFE